MNMNAFSEKTVPNEYHCATLVGNWQEERASFGAKAQAPESRTIAKETTYSTAHTPFTAAEMQNAKTLGCFSSEAPKELLFYHGDIAHPERNAVGLDELGWTDRQKETYTNQEMLDMPGVSRKYQKNGGKGRTLGASGSSSRGSSKNDVDTTDRSRALARESKLMRSMNATTMSVTTGAAEGEDEAADGEEEQSSYRPPSLPPVGRVAERERLLTTKNVTHDATGIYLYDNLDQYPLTSSATIAQMVKSKDNPMHKTMLRVEYENDK